MSYIIWPMLGAVIAVVVGAGPRRRAYRPNANSSIFAGAFGALVGRTLVEANLRARTGASVVALVRDHQVLANPKSNMLFAAGDLVGLIGDPEQVAAVARIADPPAEASGSASMLERAQPTPA